MPRIQELLANRHNEKIDYDVILSKYPWISEYNRFCVLSPDSDGLLCGLFMAYARNWKIVGFYDDKVSVINKDYKNKDVVFLDGEIFRENAKSMGHHMVCLSNKKRILLDKFFKNCIQPNLLRKYDGIKNFRLKYPLASIHLLVSIIAYADKDSSHPIILTRDAIAPLFFTDGVFQVLFSYPENVLNWLSYLRINEEWNPLKSIFENTHYSVIDTIRYMYDFFRKRDEITVRTQIDNCSGRKRSVEERGDRLKISNSDGSPYNILGINTDEIYINSAAVKRIKEFCTMIGAMTSWQFNDKDWLCWDNLDYYKFTKCSFGADGKSLTIQNFEDFIKQKPLSWAQTSNNNIEYTLESPSKFPFSSNIDNEPLVDGQLF